MYLEKQKKATLTQSVKLPKRHVLPLYRNQQMPSVIISIIFSGDNADSVDAAATLTTKSAMSAKSPEKNEKTQLNPKNKK